MAEYTGEQLRDLIEAMNMHLAGTDSCDPWHNTGPILENMADQFYADETIDLDDLINAFKNEIPIQRQMYIHQTHYGDEGYPFPHEGSHSYELCVEDEEGSFSGAVHALCVNIEGKEYVSTGFIKTLLEFVDAGFLLAVN